MQKLTILDEMNDIYTRTTCKIILQTTYILESETYLHNYLTHKSKLATHTNVFQPQISWDKSKLPLSVGLSLHKQLTGNSKDFSCINMTSAKKNSQ